MLTVAIAFLSFASQQDPAFRYLVSRKRTYYHKIADSIYIGTVNESGEFEPDPTKPPRAARTFITGGSTPHLMPERTPNEPVYEYRHRRLVPGHLVGERFIPEVGGVVVDFNVYKRSYTRASRRVYNLPGKFVTLEAYRQLERDGALTADDKEERSP